MLLLDVTQLFELLLKLFDTLASALVMLYNSNGLLLLSDLLILFFPDLTVIFLLAAL